MSGQTENNMWAEADNRELVWEELSQSGSNVKRLGRSKSTGKVLVECELDNERRELEKSYFDDGGELLKRILYEYDNDRRPKLTSVYDKIGKLVWRHDRGKGPESLEQ